LKIFSKNRIPHGWQPGRIRAAYLIIWHSAEHVLSSMKFIVQMVKTAFVLFFLKCDWTFTAKSDCFFFYFISLEFLNRIITNIPPLLVILDRVLETQACYFSVLKASQTDALKQLYNAIFPVLMCAYANRFTRCCKV
jgi:hypothetical protein